MVNACRISYAHAGLFKYLLWVPHTKAKYFFSIFFFGKALKDWDSDNYGSAQGAWYLELVARHIRLSTYVCELARHNVWAQREKTQHKFRLFFRITLKIHSGWGIAVNLRAF